jgi:dihydrofolate reductase
MRSVILFNMVTIDGFVAGPNGEIDWHRTDDEFNQFAVEQLREVGGLLFGRVTYALMESYWPTPAAEEDDPMVAEEMNRLPKVVFSRSMQSAAWQNTRLVKENAAAEVSRLKEHPGRDLFIFGSANLAASLIQSNLIDEFRLMLNPVVLGRGQPLFKDIQQPIDLKLVKNRTFQNGNILLYYRNTT